MASLPLSILASVTIAINGLAASSPTFNIGAVVGPTPVIQSVGGIDPRQREYANMTEVYADGYQTTDPEAIALNMYFSQTPAPQSGWIIRQDLTAIGAAIPTAASPGAGYAVGDIVGVTHGGASGGKVRVATIGANGAVETVALINGAQGTGYAVSAANATTTITGTGAGLEIDITSLGETLLEAIQAARTLGGTWYGVFACGAAKADHLAIMPYVQTAVPQSLYFFNSADAEVLAGAAGNVFATAFANGYSRSFGFFSTTQDGLAPNNTYLAAGAMGTAMGLNSGLAGSFYTMKFKTITGGVVEPLTYTQATALAAIGANVYVQYNNTYNFIQEGVMCKAGTYFDQIINADMLAADIQTEVVNEYAAQRAIPLTNPGQQTFLACANRACDKGVNRGWIAPGIWTGPTVLNCTTGKTLPTGYECNSELYSATNRPSGRTSLPVYVCVIQGEASHFAVIAVYLQQ